MEILNYLFQSIPVVVAIIIWAVRIEIRLAQISTDLKWILEDQSQCQQNLDDPMT